jgi:hypothetical protein
MVDKANNQPLRIALVMIGLLNLIMAIGFYIQHPWMTGLWLVPTGRLSYIFMASILAAISAGLLWIAYSEEYGSVPAGALNLSVLLGGMTIFLFLEAGTPDRAGWRLPALGAGLFTLVNIILFLKTYRLPYRHSDAVPLIPRLSFGLFTLILWAVGLALILQTPNIMPWPLQPETSVLIGLIFFGNAFYFLYAFLRPYWQFYRAQLWSFLVYDLVLLAPLINHLSGVQPELRTNLLVYLGILVYSAGLSIYFLFIHPVSRIIRYPTRVRTKFP